MPSSNSTQKFTITWNDPRQLDGEPAHAAQSAVKQLAALVDLMEEALPATVAMVRNASMSEGLAWGNNVDPAEWWEESKQFQHIKVIQSRLNALDEWATRIVRVGGH